MPDNTDPASARISGSLVSIVGLLVVATAQVSNMILARAAAGAIPPFAIAFFRWTIIALALSPVVSGEIRAGRLKLAGEFSPILATGFLGMFLCGGPVYAAGETTGAINIALIMSLSPVTVLLIAWILRLEHVKPMRLAGMALALAGTLLTSGAAILTHSGACNWRAAIAMCCSRCSAGPAIPCAGERRA